MQAWLDDRAEWIARFNKKEYAAAFEEYRENCRLSMEKLNREYLDTGSEDCLREAAVELVRSVAAERTASKGSSNRILRDCAYLAVCYLIPAIRKLEMPCSEPLERHILLTWNSAYPKQTLRGGSYEQIQGGFPKDSILAHLFRR